jgi:hypothetical protein
MRRAWKRSLAVLAAPALAFLVGMFAWTGVASAHDVSDIEVDCTHVTVHFRDFPEDGVSVHIAATVEGHAELGTDAMISGSMSGSLNISSATSALAGATAKVDVDVTWSYHGDHHEEGTFHVTCGTATTTTTHATTPTTVAPTTTMPPATTTTTAAGATTTTSTTVAESGSTPTTDVDVSAGGTASGGEGVTVEAAGATNAGGSVAVHGETATAGTGSSTLPRTGSATVPLAGIGALALLSGLAALPAARRRFGA